MIEIQKKEYVKYLKDMIAREIDDLKKYNKVYYKTPSEETGKIIIKSLKDINNFKYLKESTRILPNTYKYFIVEDEGTLTRIKFPIIDIQNKVINYMNELPNDNEDNNGDTTITQREYIS